MTVRSFYSLLSWLLFLAAASTLPLACSDPGTDRDDERHGMESASAEKAEGEGEDELQPDKDRIGEDCVAFVRSTKLVPAGATSADCPGCPAGGSPVLAFRHMKTDSVSCSGDTCTVLVTIRAVFNLGSGETIAGGLTAWIPPEQRSAYLSGHTPSGEQAYRVQITYKRRGEAWRALEFDRAPVE